MISAFIEISPSFCQCCQNWRLAIPFLTSCRWVPLTVWVTWLITLDIMHDCKACGLVGKRKDWYDRANTNGWLTDARDSKNYSSYKRRLWWMTIIGRTITTIAAYWWFWLSSIYIKLWVWSGSSWFFTALFQWSYPYFIDLHSHPRQIQILYSMLFTAAESTCPLDTCFPVQCMNCGKTTWRVSIFEIGCYLPMGTPLIGWFDEEVLHRVECTIGFKRISSGWYTWYNLSCLARFGVVALCSFRRSQAHAASPLEQLSLGAVES